MEPTEGEAVGFWLVYDEYQKRLRKRMEDKVNRIGDYADQYHDMTDEPAKKFLEEALFLGEDCRPSSVLTCQGVRR